MSLFLPQKMPPYLRQASEGRHLYPFQPFVLFSSALFGLSLLSALASVRAVTVSHCLAAINYNVYL